MSESANARDLTAPVQGVPGPEAKNMGEGTLIPSKEGSKVASHGIAREATIFVALFGGLWIIQIVVELAFRRKRGRMERDRRSIADARGGRPTSSKKIAPAAAGDDDRGNPSAEVRPETALPLGRAVEHVVSS